MGISSANTNDLQHYLDRAGAERSGLTEKLAAVAKKAQSVIDACSYGGASIHGLNNLSTFIRNMYENETFVSVVRDAVIHADRYGGNGSVNDSVIAAGLIKRGVATKPTAIQVQKMELYGLVPTSGFVDDPICAANGNFVHGDQDLALHGFASLLNVERMYNSLRSDIRGSFGFGWTSILDVRLVPLPENGIACHLADGAVVVFLPDDQGGWSENRRRRLSLAEEGSGWIVRRGPQMSWRFDEHGSLVSFAALHAVVDVDWAEDAVTLTERVSGRWVSFSISAGLVQSVASSDGRACSYAYTEGHLVRAERGFGDVHYLVVDERIESTVDADGVVLFRNEYDEIGRVASQVDQFGRLTTYEYRSDGVTVVQGSPGEPVNRMVHDASGNLTVMVDGLGEAMRIEYDEYGNRTGVVDRCMAPTRYEYDAQGNLTRRVDPDGLSHSWEWDDHERVTAEVDRAGRRTTYRYESDGRSPTTIDLPNGGVISARYDPHGLPEQVTDADGVSTSFEWNTDGLIAAMADGLNNRTTFSYDGSGRATGAVNPSGVFSTMEIDRSGRVARITSADGVESISYSAAGRPIAGTTVTGLGWTASFDPTGLVQAVSNDRGTAVSFEHDVMGQLTSVTAGDGATYRHEFDAVGRIVASIDPEGRRCSKSYDAEGRPVEISDHEGRSWVRTVDELGRTTSMAGPNGVRTSLTYHPNGEVAKRTDGAGSTWTYELDLGGQVAAVIDPHGERTSYRYSLAGRLLEVTSPLGHREQRQYDAAGHLRSIQEPDGRIISVDRRADGKVVQVAEGDGISSIQYHESGRLQELSGASDHLRFDWEAGSVSRIVQAGAASTFEWDPRGLLSKAVDPAGVVTTFEHDARGRIIRELTGDAGTQFHFGPSGWLDEVTDRDGATTAVECDSVGLLTAMEWLDDRLVRLQRAPDIEILGIEDADGRNLAAFRYDGAGRMIAASNEAVQTTFERDAIGRVVAHQTDLDSVSYVWDADGRIERVDVPLHEPLTVERDAVGRPVEYSLGTTKIGVPASGRRDGDRDAGGRLSVDELGRIYRYDDAGRLVESVDSANIATRYEYNDLGLLALEERDGSTIRYSYGRSGQLVEIAESDGSRTLFDYDAAGRRTGERLPDGSSVEYEWDGLDRLTGVITTSPDGSVRPQHITYDGLGFPVVVDDVAVRWDMGGSGRLLTVGRQMVLWHGSKTLRVGADDAWTSAIPDDPWGADGGTGVRSGYRGELALDGLVFLGARVYDARRRCFLSRDPLPAAPGALTFASAYAYAWNDPVNFVDPTGRRPLSDEEYDAIRKNLEKGTFEKAWDSMKEDPWGTLAMAAVVVVGAALCFTPLAPIGAGILIGAGLAAGVGLATGTFNPRSVAIGGVVGGITGGIGSTASMGTTMAVSGLAASGGSVADQVLVRGRGLDEVDYREVLITGAVGAGAGGAGKYFSGGTPRTSTLGSTGDDLLRMPGTSTWGNPATLDDHFLRHGADFGATSADDYARKASDFFQRGARDGIPTKLDPKTGVIRMYDPATETFGSYNASGSTRTFYIPRPGIHPYATNQEYWDAQPGALL